MKYTLVKTNNGESITALIDGELYSASDTHPNYSTVVQKVQSGTATPEDFDFKSVVEQYIALSPDTEIRDDTLYVFGAPAHTALAAKIIDSVRQGLDSTPLVKFIERLSGNPSKNSRDQLFDWLDASGFEIDDEGYVIGYKSVYSRDNGYVSVSSGEAFVEGQKHIGQIPQADGDIVSMPRHEVTDNPAIGCASGLHVGTLGYAESFSGDTIITVLVDPENVVSVPNEDCSKMRVCQYTVVGKYVKPEETIAVAEEYVFQNSSFISSAQFDGHVLTVTMKSGKSYKYNVDWQTWNDFVVADERDWPGMFYNYYIKDNTL